MNFVIYNLKEIYRVFLHLLIIVSACKAIYYSPTGGSGLGETEYFDLSYDLDNDTIFYPGQRFDFELMKDTESFNRTAKGYPFWYASYSFCMSEHGGTHVDAPFHFNKNGWKLAEIPPKRTFDVPAVVIDVAHHVFSRKHPDEFTLRVEHLLEHEAQFGQIPIGSVVLVRTGWSRFWPNKARYLGWDNSTDGEPTLHFPGLSGNAASWLVSQRQIVGVGIDTASLDVGNNRGNLPVHIIMCENQVYMIENVANLDYLISKTRSLNSYYSTCNLRLFVVPIKSYGTGGPARLLAYCKN